VTVDSNAHGALFINYTGVFKSNIGGLMQGGNFKDVAMESGNPRWENCILREVPLYVRADDIRTDFARDYNRILHSTAYRRLKHKTQVFFATTNDHICTRIEHVNHVASISHTIAKFLGLNPELTSAIAIGHDLGHAPFGHAGEDYIKEIVAAELGEHFWHEKNSLRFVDHCETLEDPNGRHKNLNLTYAVRDGIISHCGEVDENAIFPREQSIDLATIAKPNEYMPYTWEGCVVKISDKIAYLGRDIEDALTLKILTRAQLKELSSIVKEHGKYKVREINNTLVIHELIIDICKNSNPQTGIVLSDESLRVMNSLKEFNYKNIYLHARLDVYREYARLIIRSLFSILKRLYEKEATLEVLRKYIDTYPVLITAYYEWLLKYGTPNERNSIHNKYENKILYDLKKEKDYLRAVIDFISGMTDLFAIKVFTEITRF
jgi:dGTPase